MDLRTLMGAHAAGDIVEVCWWFSAKTRLQARWKDVFFWKTFVTQKTCEWTTRYGT